MRLENGDALIDLAVEGANEVIEPHCIAGSWGADFSDQLKLPGNARLVSKATQVDKEAYSSFAGTDLHERLQSLGVRRLFIGGLTTEAIGVVATPSGNLLTRGINGKKTA